jgi:hypothetical protein
MGRPPKHDLSTWTVVDDWPDPVPVTEVEIAVFERWFGDVFDELFDPPAPPSITPETSAHVEETDAEPLWSWPDLP